MKLIYYAQSDILHVQFSDKPIGRSQHLDHWTNLAFATDGTLQSIEMIKAAARGIDVTGAEVIADESTEGMTLPTKAELAAGRTARAAAIRDAQKQ